MLLTTCFIRAVPDHVSSNMDGETVILSLASGVYYGLDTVGSRIWGLIQKPQRVTAVRDTLLAEYEVIPEQCERELLALLNRLIENGLVEVQYATAD